MKVISVGNPTPSGIWHFVRINGQELNVLSEKPLVPGNLYQIKKTFFNKLAIVSEQGPAEKAATGETTVVPDPGYSIFAESGFHQIFQIILEQEKDAQFNRVSGGYSFSLPVLGIGKLEGFFRESQMDYTLLLSLPGVVDSEDNRDRVQAVAAMFPGIHSIRFVTTLPVGPSIDMFT